MSSSAARNHCPTYVRGFFDWQASPQPGELQIWGCGTNIQQDWSQLSSVPSRAGPISLQPHPGDCIDNSAGNLTNNNKIQIWSCTGLAAQNWTVESDATIHSGSSGYCIGVSAGGTTNGSPLVLYSCNGHTDQTWVPQSNGSLRNLKSPTCLDDPNDSTTNGTQLQIWGCGTNPQQNWTLP
jgi:hypothetical protein